MSLLQSYTVHKGRAELMGVEWYSETVQTTIQGMTIATLISQTTATKVLEGMPAAAAGVPEKWRLYSVNGKRVGKPEDMYAMKEMDEVVMEMYPPGVKGDHCWLQVSRAATEASTWGQRWAELHQSLSAKYPSADLGWIVAVQMAMAEENRQQQSAQLLAGINALVGAGTDGGKEPEKIDYTSLGFTKVGASWRSRRRTECVSKW
eukprot:Sspe_Gene.110760::Locus_91826_Transcript_1_9_Confidence_0.550_Length_790::g.110760::m.110760